MTFRILVVCRANVCRSPLIAAALEQLLAVECSSGEVSIQSAGVEAIEGQEPCAAMVELARSAGLDSLTRRQHRAQPLTAELLAQAELIIAADRGVRSAVIRRAGSKLGDRVFTLREAAQLATMAVAPDPTPPAPPRPTTAGGAAGGAGARSVTDRLRDVTAAMHARRGFADLPGTDRFIPLTRPWRPMTLSTLDVPDAHGVPTAPHRVVYRLAIVNTVQLVHAMDAGYPPGHTMRVP